ncbi:MAG TPA: FadR/GntR family transcriptional regulator [Ktedonobacterales bacterium]|nr:FadR/GntR family transcriptional regulator [Ktedonobacterales bacterium]HEX5570631.1 FadR/GntR family transcriptional regulator [Ktedonobacterales bacterium]
MMYQPVGRSKLFERIVEQIQGRIVRGELRAGDRLPPERELALAFGASRTAVREALKTLAQMGLVDMRPGRGTIITDNTFDAMRSSLGLMLRVGQHSPDALVELRQIIEPEIAALAAERATETHIAALREAVEMMERSLRRADTYIEADNRFHRTLALASRNPLIVSLVDSIVGLLSEQRARIFSVPGGPERGQVYHKTLLDAVERRDVERARTAMRAHLTQVSEDVAAAPTDAATPHLEG